MTEDAAAAVTDEAAEARTDEAEPEALEAEAAAETAVATVVELTGQTVANSAPHEVIVTRVVE